MSGNDSWVWTAPQRRILIVALLIFSAFLTLRLLHNQQFVPDPLPTRGPRAAELQWRLDLNTADTQALSAIPRLGETKAKAIVDYRTQFQSTHPGQLPFHRFEDLFRVKGIGAGTVAMLKQYAAIPAATRSSTAP